MSSFFFLLSFSIMRLIALLPLWFLYRISDLLYPIIYYLLRYRREVVFKNLHNAFPSMDEAEINRTARRFYRHFADMIIETIKTIGMTPEEIRQRIHLVNPELVNELYNEQKSIILVASHYANWEWLMGLAGAVPYHTLAVYKPLQNKRMDRIMKNARSKAGTELVAMRWVLKTLSQMQRDHILTFSLFVADQSPVREEAEYWTRFLNQDTAVFLGIEKIAIRYKHAVLFCHTRRLKRGYYEVELVPVCLNPGDSHPYEITEIHTRLLEKMIREEPAYWLWSHRRWKLKRTAPVPQDVG